MQGRRHRVVLLSCALVAACVPVKPKEADAPPPAPVLPLPTAPVVFELESVDDHEVNAAAFRGKPAVFAFVVSDTMAGQGQATILSTLAEQAGGRARFVVVAVEPFEHHELVQGFLRFFTDHGRSPLLGAMADKETLAGAGPFGDVRVQTVLVLDAAGHMVFRRAGIVQAPELTEVLRGLSP